jgi:hypothetical protein
MILSSLIHISEHVPIIKIKKIKKSFLAIASSKIDLPSWLIAPLQFDIRALVSSFPAWTFSLVFIQTNYNALLFLAGLLLVIETEPSLSFLYQHLCWKLVNQWIGSSTRLLY